MARFGYLVLLVFLLFGCGTDTTDPRENQARATGSPSTRETRASSAPHLPGSYIVTFRVSPGGPGLRFASYLDEYRSHFPLVAAGRLNDPDVKSIDFLTSLDLSAASLAQDPDLGLAPPLRQLWQNNPESRIGAVARVDFTSDTAAADILRKWSEQGSIWFAEPNYISHTNALQGGLFQDLARDYQDMSFWWIKSVQLAAAFSSIAGRDLSVPGIPSDQYITENQPVIAVMDSGVDYEHPALKDRMWINTDVNASGCDDDVHGCNTTELKRGKLGNGEVFPYDTTGPAQPCLAKDPNCSHGTHVAGIIAGNHTWNEPEFGRRVPGVCPVCKIMVLKIVSKVGKESGILDSSIIAAFKYITRVSNKDRSAVRVINASFGKFVRSRTVGIMVRLMKEKRGVILIGAAGNEDTLTMEFPAAFSDAVAVAAVDSRLNKVAFSNFGRWVDISAPGSNILSTVPGGGLDTKSGTSMAAPMVAGVAGLMIARHPDISFGTLRKWLLESADPGFYRQDHGDGINYNYYYPKIPQESVRQPMLGYGVLNASGAVNLAPAQDLPLFTSMDRVQKGCSVLGAAARPHTPHDYLLLVILLLPAALVPWMRGGYRRQVRRAILR